MAARMLEKETSAYFNGTVKQLSLLLVRRVLVFIIRVKCRREHLTQVTRLERDRIFISKFTYFRSYIERFAKILREGIQTPMISFKSTFPLVSMYHLILYRFSSTLDFYHSNASKYVAI